MRLGRKHWLWAIAVAAALYLAPKLRLNPESPGVTNNVWGGVIVYEAAGDPHVVRCIYSGRGATPRFEADMSGDEDVCRHIPVYLHQGLPPRTVDREGRSPYYAPMFLGRLI